MRNEDNNAIRRDHDTMLACHRNRSHNINEADVPVSGCFAGGMRNAKSTSEQDILSNRRPWAPLRRGKTPIQRICQSNEPPFCTALSRWEAERFGPQYMALQKCNDHLNGGYTVDAVTTCAVLVIGAGGLGSPLLMYLAAGGIGIIGIMDGDIVEVSNLHRQIVHDEENEGMNKAISAKKRLTKINSQGTYIVYDRFFGEDEAEQILPQYDIIVDATDNPQTRYLINDACVKYNKTLVIASSIGVQGQLMVFNRSQTNEDTPCYRCISPLEGNPFVNVRRGACSFAGVLGTLPGILGCIQATEVLKIAAGATDAVLGQGKMLIYDTMNVTKPFRCVQLKKNRNCEACGVGIQHNELKMMPWQTCKINEQVDDSAISNETFWNIYMNNIHHGIPVKAAVKLQGRLLHVDPQGEMHTVYLLDVRPTEHYSLCHLSGATNWPVATILDDVSELHHSDKDEERNQIYDLLTRRCLVENIEGSVLLLFICFLGNSSRIATEAVREAIKEYGSPVDMERIKCFSIAGGCRGIRTKLGIEMPLS